MDCWNPSMLVISGFSLQKWGIKMLIHNHKVWTLSCYNGPNVQSDHGQWNSTKALEMSGFCIVLPLDHPSVSPRGNIVENPTSWFRFSVCLRSQTWKNAYMSTQTITFDSNGVQMVFSCFSTFRHIFCSRHRGCTLQHKPLYTVEQSGVTMQQV